MAILCSHVFAYSLNGQWCMFQVQHGFTPLSCVPCVLHPAAGWWSAWIQLQIAYYSFRQSPFWCLPVDWKCTPGQMMVGSTWRFPLNSEFYTVRDVVDVEHLDVSIALRILHCDRWCWSETPCFFHSTQDFTLWLMTLVWNTLMFP